MPIFKDLEALLIAVKERPLDRKRDLILECTMAAQKLARNGQYRRSEAVSFRIQNNFTQSLIDYETELENMQYNSELFAGENIDSWIQEYNHFERFSSLVDQTIDLLQLIGANDESRIIFVGTGAFPLTTIALARKFPTTEILSIEKNVFVAKCARNVISRFSDIRNVKIISSDVLSLCNEFRKKDVVVCSFIVGQQLLIDGTLEKLLDSVVESNGTIIFRDACEMVEAIYSSINWNSSFELECPKLNHQFQVHKVYGNSAFM